MALPAVAVTSTSEGTGCSPQQEVVIPDSEGSPEGCSPLRQEAHAASPPLTGRPIKTLGNDMTDTHLVALQHSSAQHKVACHSNSSHDRSGCLLEALPYPEVCTQSVHAEQHTGLTQNCGVDSQAASQQQTCPPQSMSFAAAFLRHDTDEGAQPRAAAAEGFSSRMAAEPSTWPGMDANTNDGPTQNITFSRRPGPEHTLWPAQQAVSSVQHTDISLPGSVSSLAPATAGPVEHLGDDKIATGLGDAAPRGGDDQQGGGQGPIRAQAGAVAGLDQQVSNRAHPLDGSQPSSSSLKRVPETPDSAENRSQPTQFPDGKSTHRSLFVMLQQWSVAMHTISAYSYHIPGDSGFWCMLNCMLDLLPAVSLLLIWCTQRVYMPPLTLTGVCTGKQSLLAGCRR